MEEGREGEIPKCYWVEENFQQQVNGYEATENKRRKEKEEAKLKFTF